MSSRPTSSPKDTLHSKIPRLSFSGFLKHDIFYDTRQTVNAREALVTLYPEKVELDAENRDINARPGFNMLNIHSRLRANLYGPSVLGARSEALIEADFYGNENKNFSDLNGLRLFNAYLRLMWKTTALQFGQDWHPLSIQAFFPTTVAFSAGAPFHPMSRNPQVRLTQSMGKLDLTASVLTQRDFTSTGPEGPGSRYLRDAAIPNLHLQAVYGKDTSLLSGGVGVDYKQIVPEQFTQGEEGQSFKSDSRLSSWSATAFLKLVTKPFQLKAQGVYAQNGYDQLMLGGYAKSSMADLRTGESTFTNLNTVSGWMDIQTNRTRRLDVGLFSGYTQNLGAFKDINGPIYARGADIQAAYRLAPRIIYTVKNISFSMEGEHTTAWYGTANGDGKGIVTDTYTVSNFRTLVSTRYTF